MNTLRTALRRSVARRRARRAATDAGVTLIEVLVSMSLMSVVMALVGTGMTQLYSAANSGDALTVVTQQVHDAFLRLDHTVRYASGISVPGKVNNNWYVEYQVTNTGTTACTQLRVSNSGLLQTRTQVGTGPIGGWSVLASSLTGSAAATTLQRNTASSSGNPHQQLVLTLTATDGAGSSARTATMSFTFTALNTYDFTSSDTICTSLDRT